MNDAFLLCRDCGVLYRLSAGAQHLGGEPDPDFELFCAEHGSHVIEGARRLDPPALLDRPPGDPMATAWFEVAAGAEVFVVRSSRTSIDEPRRHEIAPGAPETVDAVDVDEALLRRALDRHFYPHAIRAAKIECVVGAVRDLLQELPAGGVETTFDDATLPNTGIGPFPAELCERLVACCAPVFDAWEIERLRAFVADHRGEDGALAVRVHRRLRGLH